ncbi:MAG TPA: ABC transporter permease [Vicinamibacteria bacterium]|nr:ABC transporter permease [Vicinamibacteria bacterium]
MSALPRLRAVARREYVARVRSKAFVVITILGPAIMAGFLVVPTLVMSRQRGRPLRVAVLDGEGSLRAAVEESLARREAAGAARFDVRPAPGAAGEDARDGLRAAVLRGDLDAYVYLPADAVQRSVAEYHGRNVSNMMDIGLVDAAVEEALIGRRLTDEGLAKDAVRSLTRKVDLKTVRLSASGEREDRGGSFFLSMVLMTMLYTAVAMWGAAVMNGVIEEKTSRVVEIVVSSLPTWTFFAGKLLGVGAAGLTQFGIWGASLGLLSLWAAAMAATSGTAIPEISPLLVVSFVTCFVLGYFLYAALFAAVGAMVNSQQDAQALVFPVMAPLLTAFIFFPAVLGAPDSTLSTTLSLVPFFAPLLMFLRVAAAPPPAWQLVLCLALCLATIALVTWLASRIYRVGILMYGKRATLPEIFRWIKQS